MSYKLIYLEWQDASSMDEWTSEEKIDKWLKANEKDAGFVVQVGWIVRETPKFLIMASMKAPENDYQDIHWSHLQKIPKTWVRKRKELKI